jgi:oxygen-dependent protoporphyrinogen oxidase
VSRVVVVGGGISGLVRGFALRRRGEDVRVLEATDRPGGAMRTESVEGFLLELGPNTIRPSPELWGLVRELGLEGEARFADPRLPRFIEFRGRLHALAPGPAFLATSLLSAKGKARLFAEPFVRRAGDPRETVHAFFARRFGREVAERLAAPFVSGIWAGDTTSLSASEAFPTLARWEREHGSLLRGALASRRWGRSNEPAPPRGLLSFRGGLETLPRTLSERLGDALTRNARARSLTPAGDGWRVETEAGVFEADRVVVATGAADAARLLRPLDAEAADALAAVPMPPLAVAHIAFPKDAFPAPLRGFGHLVVPDAGRRVLGAVWSSALLPDRAPADQELLTAFLGGSRDPAAAAFSDEVILETAGAELATSLGARARPRLLRVTRYAAAIPQYDLGHAARRAAFDRAEARLPGLTLIGNYRGGISVTDVVRSALETG